MKITANVWNSLIICGQGTRATLHGINFDSKNNRLSSTDSFRLFILNNQEFEDGVSGTLRVNRSFKAMKGIEYIEIDLFQFKNAIKNSLPIKIDYVKSSGDIELSRYAIIDDQPGPDIDRVIHITQLKH